MSQYRKLPIGKLKIDHSYQREGSESRAKKFVREFDLTLFGCIDVNQREDGQMYVWDGQHRLMAARIMKWESIPSLLTVGMTQQEEARAFVDKNTKQKAPTSLEKFRARVQANEPVAMDIARIAEETGWRIRAGSEPNTIAAGVSVEKVYRRGGPEILRWTLKQHKLWTPEDQAQGATVAGLGYFKIIAGIVDDERLAKKVYCHSINDVLRKSRELSPYDSGSASRPKMVALAISWFYLKGAGTLTKENMAKRFEAFSTREPVQDLEFKKSA